VPVKTPEEGRGFYRQAGLEPAALDASQMISGWRCVGRTSTEAGNGGG